MRRALSRALMILLFVLAACTGTPAPSPTSETGPTPGEVEPTAMVPTVVEVLPTPTPRPPPPTPTPPPSPTPEPDATAAPTTEVTAAPMISIPAGEFLMGNDAGGDDEKPAHRLFVDSFEIDQFEVTNEQFQAFVDETAYVTGAELTGEGQTWRDYAQGKPKHPVVAVSWNDAAAYCEWQGKRLPTEAEWEKAARGTEGNIYPWGNEWAPDKANAEESGYRGTLTVGSLPDGASPYGVMDMAGNVAEWTSDWYDRYPGSTFASAYFGKKYRVIRGGGWFTEAELVRTTERSASTEDLSNDDVGFRCVR